MDCALDLMRRLPPQQIEKNLSDLIDLVPSLCEDLLSSVDQPLKIAKDKESGKDYLLCDYNRDGDSYRFVCSAFELVLLQSWKGIICLHANAIRDVSQISLEQYLRSAVGGWFNALRTVEETRNRCQSRFRPISGALFRRWGLLGVLMGLGSWLRGGDTYQEGRRRFQED